MPRKKMLAWKEKSGKLPMIRAMRATSKKIAGRVVSGERKFVRSVKV